MATEREATRGGTEVPPAGAVPATKFAAALTALQALPWLLFLLPGISLISVASESIGYRYFHSLRLVRGENSSIWAAQGQALGLLHQAGQHLLDWAGITDLQTRVDWFSYGTLALNSLGFFWIARRLARAVGPDRITAALVGGAALCGVYGSWWGLTAARLPDYYTFEVTFTFACAAWFVIQHRHPDPSMATAVRAGLLGGVMVMTKITLLPAAFLPLVPALAGPARPVRRLGFAAGWAVTVGITAGLIVLAYYRFDLAHLGRAFAAWRSYVAAPGAEPGFIASILRPFAAGHNPWADHRFLPFVIALWGLALIGSHGLAARGFVLLCSALHGYAIVRRPAETTLFESALFLTLASAALLAVQPPGRMRRRLAAGWLALALIACTLSTQRHFPRPAQLSAFRDTARSAWEMHRWLTAQHRPVVVVLPDNRYTSGSVEEALLKGFSDVPTWDITSGYALLDAVAPQRLFVPRLSTLPAGSVLVWTEGPGLPPALPDGQPVPTTARSWTMLRNAYWSRIVHAAIIPAAANTAEIHPVADSAGWPEAGSGQLPAGFFVGPGEAAPKIEAREEGGRRILRVTATRAASYLAVGAMIPALPDLTPVWLEAVVRPSRDRMGLWQFYDVVGDHGRAENPVEPLALRADRPTRWTALRPALRAPAANDNASVGIVAPQPGDWIEIESFSLRAGPAPAGLP